MFDEINKTEEQENELPENIFGDSEPEINNNSETGEHTGKEEKTEVIPQKEEEEAQIAEARSRALAQVQKMSRDAGFSGPWSNLFRRYPSLTREAAYAELGDAVRGGMTPLEAYQQKLLSEKENELRIAKNNSAAANRSVGPLEGDGGERELDEFLAGFYSV